MRWPVTFVVVCFLTLPLSAGDQKDNATLSVPGQFSVKVPLEGYKWEKVREEELEGIKYAVFTASKEDVVARLTLAVIYRKVDKDEVKSSLLKGDWNGLVTTLMDGGFTELKGKQPSFDSPIPREVRFGITCKNPAGEAVAFQTVKVFGKNVYTFQSVAGTAVEADKLTEAIKSLKE